jgi:thioredoxin 1
MPHDAHDAIPPVDDQSFEAEVLRSPVPVLLDFGAPWCRPCVALEPVLGRIARESGGSIRVAKVDTETSPGLAARLGVRAVPTVVAFVGGRERARHTGLTTADKLLGLLGDRG